MVAADKVGQNAAPIPSGLAGNYIDRLKSKGLKVTEPRLKILRLFESRPKEHLSAEKIYRIVLDERMGIGIATVYRVLTQFEEAGILTRHRFEMGKAVYELNRGDHHDHMVCVRYGAVFEFCDEEIEMLQRRIAQIKGFDVVEHALYMYGICAKCQAKERHEAEG